MADIRRLMVVAGRLIAESRLLIAESQQLIDAHQWRDASLSALVSDELSGPTLPGA